MCVSQKVLQHCNIVQNFHRDLQWFCSNLITKFCFCSLCCIKFVLTFAPFIFTTDGMIPTKISVEEDDHHEGKSHLCFKILYKVEKTFKSSLDFIPSPSPSVKIQIMGGKVYCRSQQTFENKKFLDNTQQCFALLPQVNFPANNLNFHYRWRWWDQIQAIFLSFIHFNRKKYLLFRLEFPKNLYTDENKILKNSGWEILALRIRS